MTTVYHGGKVLAQQGDTHSEGCFILTRPQNSQDMNYHLYDLDTGEEHLIDIGDVVDNAEELEEYGGILFSTLCELDDMDSIMDTVWKTI